MSAGGNVVDFHSCDFFPGEKMCMCVRARGLVRVSTEPSELFEMCRKRCRHRVVFTLQYLLVLPSFVCCVMLSTDLSSERWFDLVVILRSDNDVL